MLSLFFFMLTTIVELDQAPQNHEAVIPAPVAIYGGSGGGEPEEDPTEDKRD